MKIRRMEENKQEPKPRGQIQKIIYFGLVCGKPTRLKINNFKELNTKIIISYNQSRVSWGGLHFDNIKRRKALKTPTS